MVRRVFFSFHYERDIWRANCVRNSWVTKPDREDAGFWDSAGVQVAVPIADEVREFLRSENAEEFLKRGPEGLGGKRLGDYDVIVAMEKEHRDYVLSLCPECGDKVVVWNVRDPYFMNRENTWKVYKEIKEKVTELVNSQQSQSVSQIVCLS